MWYYKSLRFGYRYKRTLKTLSVKETLSSKPLNCDISVQGWVQALRKHKDLFFVDLVDGSCIKRLQVIIKPNGNSYPSYGNSITVNGSLVKSKHAGQDVELQCSSWNIIGSCPPKDYPFSTRQRHSPQYTRQFLHLRPRTKTFGALLRIRNAASMAIHNFFQDQAFQFVHTPIISSNDCEGAGEVFIIKAENENVNAEQVLSTKMSIAEEKEFFNVPSFLTVSGQLHLEAVACALSRVYNFGPVFRAENTRTRHHLSEFYMVEAEIAFIESLDILLKFVENIYKHTVQHILDMCSDDFDYLCNVFTSDHKVNIQKILHNPFACISYTEAISILEKHKNALECNIKWGDDLLTEHEQFLIQYCDNTPVFITNFPSVIKPFYMKEETDSTASCFDLLASFGGEICGGSLRESNEEILKNKLVTLNMEENLSWYMDLRKFGSVPHGGFGIGFERLLQSILGIPNIREVIPFPRWTHHCQL